MVNRLERVGNERRKTWASSRITRIQSCRQDIKIHYHKAEAVLTIVRAKKLLVIRAVKSTDVLGVMTVTGLRIP